MPNPPLAPTARVTQARRRPVARAGRLDRLEPVRVFVYIETKFGFCVGIFTILKNTRHSTVKYGENTDSQCRRNDSNRTARHRVLPARDGQPADRTRPGRAVLREPRSPTWRASRRSPAHVRHDCRSSTARELTDYLGRGPAIELLKPRLRSTHRPRIAGSETPQKRHIDRRVPYRLVSGFGVSFRANQTDRPDRTHDTLM